MAEEPRKAEMVKDVGLFGTGNLKKGQTVNEAEIGTETFENLLEQGYAKKKAATAAKEG